MDLSKEIISFYGAHQVIDVLAPFLSKIRLNKIDQVLSSRLKGIELAIERPYDIHNGFAAIRTAEAMGIYNIHFIDAQLKKGQGRSTTRGALKWVNFKRHVDSSSFMPVVKGMKIAGACCDGKMLLSDLPISQPVCFVFGNEKDGLSKDMKKKCDYLFKLPMFGMMESYNLSVAAAITLFDYQRRLRDLNQSTGNLSSPEKNSEKARFIIQTLGLDQSHKLLKRLTLSKPKR